MPRTPIAARIAGSALLLCALSACVLNPQPLPPGTADSAAPADTVANPKLDAGEADVQLNHGQDLEGGAGETGAGTDGGGIDGTLPQEAGGDVVAPPPPGEAGSDAPAEASPSESSTDAGSDADLSESGAG